MPNTRRMVPRTPKIWRKTSWDSSVKAWPVMASVLAGSTLLMRSVSSCWLTSSWPDTLIHVNLPGSVSSSWAVAVSNSAADVPA